MSIALNKISETQSKITLGWTPVAGCIGYVFYADGARVSNTWDPNKNQITFSKGPAQFKVVAVGNEDEGVYPSVAPPPPPPGGWVVSPPVGPLTDRNGGATQSQWRFDYTVGPVTVEKQHIHDYTSYGYGEMAWVNNAPVESPPNVRSTIRDLRIERITRVPPRSSNGTAEAGIWVGQTADVSRIDIASAAWMQVWTGARCYRSVFEDILMRDTRLVGIYPEHNTWDTTFRRFVNTESPGQLANVVNQEWWYSGEGSKNLNYDQFDLYVPAGSWAFFIDAGNGGTKIAPTPGSRIWGPGNGIIFPNKIVAGLGPNQAWLDNIDMSQLAGTKLAYHDNAIGSMTQRVRGWVGLAPKHHPGTFRMPKDVSSRLSELKR